MKVLSKFELTVKAFCLDENIFLVEDKKLRKCDLDLNEMVSIDIFKSPTRMRIHDKNTLVISDKFGDLHTYSKDLSNKKLELGHVSMVTDFVINEHIYTCDRDEKIRASSFPKGYNIQFFCLGHTEYVSKLLVFEDKLISGGGDYFLCVWKLDKLVDKIELTIPNSVDANVLDIVKCDNDFVVLLEDVDKLFVYNEYKLKMEVNAEKPKKGIYRNGFLYLVCVGKILKLDSNYDIIDSVELEIGNSYSVSQLRKISEY